MRKPIITIVGRPNVGKSTLFNRIVGKREAIVDDLPGVTRDRKYAEADWSGVEFMLVDTGGYFPRVEDIIGKEILKQVDSSISESNVVIFLTDGRAGLTALDREIGQILQRCERPVVLAVNKIDHPRMGDDAIDFFQLGLGEPQTVSAENGRDVGDLLDRVLAFLPEELKSPPNYEEEENDDLHLAIVGKPNVGKSSFVNAILGQYKHIVTDIPGTTRDAIDTRIRFQDEDLILVDTAGLRRRTKVHENVEYYSTLRSLEAIRRCQVALVLIDAVEGLSDQDIRIISEVVRFNKGIVLAINKWDLIEKDAKTASEFEKGIREQLHALGYMPIIFISALTRQRIFKALELAIEINTVRQQKIKTSELNTFLQEIIAKYPPPSMDRKEVKINYMTQVKYGPPVFALFVNHPTSIKSNYRQYIENQFRNRFSFPGVPLTFVYKKKA
ncbi:MAG: ribosome biogenesis GTPase Der [Deferribacteres bacterium]|nr:ribosome biogenesis GTPase Der [candidate division KSB1 bacterium]MCB9509256.1 ribosome biogenesis GTPase Der [Deferribacteres bacterium]